MALHKSWRDCQAWRDEKLEMTTTSNEASKMFDAILTQYVGWYEEKSLGGLEKTMQTMKQADPDFVLGEAICNGLSCLGGGESVYTNPKFKETIDNMLTLASKSNITQREQGHVNAVKLWSEGCIPEACLEWENILLTHPTDMMAIKFAHGSYFYLGYQEQLRDSVSRVLPHWSSDIPNYGYLMGMYGFGLVETNFYDKAEKYAKKGLAINPCDIWSSHANAHVLEMTGKQQEGINFLTSTADDWEKCDMLVPHIYWHLALYYIEKGDYEQALSIYDTEMLPRFKKSTGVSRVSNGASLLQRLEFNNVNVGDRWNDLYEEAKLHIDEHTTAYGDMHVVMACVGAKQRDTAKQMVQSVKEFVQNGFGHSAKVISEVGQPMIEAFEAYGREDYATAVNHLYPVRYRVTSVGGSNAQRDVVNLLLIVSAMLSPLKEHNKLARQLLLERQALRENSPMTERLMAKTLALHTD